MTDSDSPLPPRTPAEVDFPYQRTESEHVTRREFAKFLCLVSGGMAVGNGWVAVKDKLFPPHRLKERTYIARADEIPLGGTHVFRLEGSTIPYILIHLMDGTFRAFEQRCTHLACAVFYSPEKDYIECPCHHGGFNARTGNVLHGPPPRPLRQLAVVREGNELYVWEMEANGKAAYRETQPERGSGGSEPEPAATAPPEPTARPTPTATPEPTPKPTARPTPEPSPRPTPPPTPKPKTPPPPEPPTFV